jgi:dolichol-phosphate mannosyltransferase
VNSNLVIIPTYNEKENIEAIIAAVFALEKPFDILIVDDNSPDGTSDIVRKLITGKAAMGKAYNQNLYLITRKGKHGLGTAYIEGFRFGLEHNYDYIFEMDADFSHNPADLVRLLDACERDGYDMAIGSRYVTGVNVVNWPMGRVLMSYLASTYVRFITGMPIRDTTAGFKCYSRKVLQTIDLDKVKFMGYAFQIEMKFDTWKYGFQIKEVPIIFTDRTRGESKMSSGIFKEAVLGVMKLKISSWFRKYNKPADLA